MGVLGLRHDSCGSKTWQAPTSKITAIVESGRGSDIPKHTAFRACTTARGSYRQSGGALYLSKVLLRGSWYESWLSRFRLAPSATSHEKYLGMPSGTAKCLMSSADNAGQVSPQVVNWEIKEGS